MLDRCEDLAFCCAEDRSQRPHDLPVRPPRSYSALDPVVGHLCDCRSLPDLSIVRSLAAVLGATQGEILAAIQRAREVDS